MAVRERLLIKKKKKVADLYREVIFKLAVRCGAKASMCPGDYDEK